MRKNISMSAAVEARAQEIIKARGFDGLSDLLAALVREEFERRQPPVLHDPATPYKTQGELSSARKAELADEALAVAKQALKKKQKKTSHPA